MNIELSEDNSLLVQYLLGELPPDIQERVEERCMLDDEFSGQCGEVEFALVDAYVEGTLSPEQRKHFLTRYLITPNRRDRVEAAHAFKIYRTHIANSANHGVTREAPKGLVREPNSQLAHFARMCGLHPMTALVLSSVSFVSIVLTWGTLGVGMPVVIALVPLTAIVTWKMQTKLFGDSNTSGVVKGFIAMALIAIPFPVAPAVFVPASILGIIWLRARRSR